MRKEINRLHAVFLECGITEIKRKDLATNENRDRSIKILKGFALKQAERSLRRIGQIEEQIDEVETELDKEIEGDKNVEALIGIPGVGKQLAASYIAFIGGRLALPQRFNGWSCGRTGSET